MVTGTGCFFFFPSFFVSDIFQETTPDRLELLLQKHYWTLISVCLVPGCSTELCAAGSGGSSLHLNINSLLPCSIVLCLICKRIQLHLEAEHLSTGGEIGSVLKLSTWAQMLKIRQVLIQDLKAAASRYRCKKQFFVKLVLLFFPWW